MSDSGKPGQRGEADVPPAKPIGQVDASVIPRFAGIRTFARLPSTDQVERVDVAILGAPFDGATTFRAGARFGPAAIREASLLLRPYNEGLDVAPFDRLQVADAGDAPASPIGVEAAHAAIEAAARGLVEDGAAVLGLGGDHSVSLPLLRATAAEHGALSLIQFDAHTDTWDSYFGERLTHGTMFRRAVEEGIVDGTTSIQVGLRGSLYDSGDYDANAALGFKTVLAREFDDLGVSGVVRRIRETVGAHCYVTVDVDVLDPGFAPGTGTPEAGGLSTRELLALIRGLEADCVVRGADVVEVSPPYDLAGITAVAAANAAFELLALLSLSRQSR